MSVELFVGLRVVRRRIENSSSNLHQELMQTINISARVSYPSQAELCPSTVVEAVSGSAADRGTNVAHCFRPEGDMPHRPGGAQGAVQRLNTTSCTKRLLAVCSSGDMPAWRLCAGR